MKKIVRLTENDLTKLVKRVIKEYNGINNMLPSWMRDKQQSSSPQKGDGGLMWAAAAEQFRGEQIRFYHDEANTKIFFTIVIKNMSKDSSGVTITSNNGSEYKFNCNNNFMTMIDPGTFSTKNIYNKVFIEDIKKIYCVKSTGGTGVTNIGKYSSVDSNKPNNYV
jgi:hypothetical protein